MGGRVASPTFVGRIEELQTLEAARKRAADADPTVVLVGGEAGIGKTRLVTECASRCAADGMRVLLGGCVPVGDGALPYAPGHTVNDLHTLPKLSPDEPLGHPRRDTARTPPTGTDESKTAIATSGWATRLRECLASGNETQ